jgi:DNA replication protein DnaC
VLIGPTGVGKTCAMAIAMRWAQPVAKGERLQQPFFVHWPEFIRDVGRFNRDYRDFPDRGAFDPQVKLENYAAALFVDNLGEERAVNSGYEQGWAEMVFADFVCRRAGMKVGLWITTNLSERELKSRYGEPSISRLREHCAFITLKGADRRLAS